MTYLELADESARDFDRGKITLGEYEERIKPLCDEIKPWNSWIPAGERLPEQGKNVLLCTNGVYWDDEITAWQSLPNPYHAESEDK